MLQAEEKDGVPVCEDIDGNPWICLSDHYLWSDGLLYHLISFLQTRSLKTNPSKHHVMMHVCAHRMCKAWYIFSVKIKQNLEILTTGFCTSIQIFQKAGLPQISSLQSSL